MSRTPNHITIFEHQSLIVGRNYNDVLFEEKHQLRLETFYGEKGVPYYNLIHKGVHFNEFVGVLKIGKLVIEVLPKADKYTDDNEWRSILIAMLRAVGAFNIHAPSSSSLSIKSNFILDLYFELFIKEVEYLFNKGLIRKYRKTEGNTLSLKGNILFSKHIQQNLVHKERFYVKHSTYDNEHLIHQLLYKTILILKQINTNIALNSSIGNLLLNFPEMKDVKVSEAVFNKITLTRKTKEYKNALEISRLLLLNYHPDLSNGQNHVLALMFDMNLLWEKFIYVSLRKNLKDDMSITAQTSKYFWKPDNGYNSVIRPDIVIKKNNESYVLDTKWKNIGDKNPSPDDLRQMYVYHEYYGAKKVALIYPGEEKVISGRYYKTDKTDDFEKICSILRIKTDSTINVWQNNITSNIGRWLEKDVL